MSNEIEKAFIQDAVDWALTHGLALKTGEGSADHCAFSVAPVQINRDHFWQLQQAVALMGKMIHAVSEDYQFLRQSLEILGSGDCLFDYLLKLHQQIHTADIEVRCQPMLIMRTDFMDDAETGPKVIEFNGIAAGMGPFGEKAHQLHGYLQRTPVTLSSVVGWEMSLLNWSQIMRPLSWQRGLLIQLLPCGTSEVMRGHPSS